MATSRPSRLLLTLAICALGCSVPKPNFNDGSTGESDSGCTGDACARRIESIAAGSQHTCVAFDDGSVACFGNPDDGRLGALITDVPRDETYRPLPVVESVLGEFLPLAGASQLLSGDRTTCGFRSDGRAVCWGAAEIFASGNSGQTATSIRDERGEASPAHIALGPRLALILTDGVARSAGHLTPLGRPETTEGLFEPIAGLPSGVRVRAIAVAGLGDDQGAVLATETGEVYCWGGAAAQLCGEVAGDGERARLLPGLTSITEVCGGLRHACATNGTDVFCWGDGDGGRLATASDELQPTPTMVANSWGTPIDRLVCGEHVTLLITDGAQELWGWGQNRSGELGVAHLDPVRSPRRLLEAEPGETLDVAAGGHVCVWRRSSEGDEVLCAGPNRSGQIGRPRTTSSTSEFTPIPDLP